MKSDMPTKSESTLKAHSAITSAHPEVRDWLGLSAVLDDLYEAATMRAAFDHQMAVLAYQYARAITKTGPGIVAERLGITVEELQERIQPARFAEITMSELRLLSLCVEVEVTYDVIPLKAPDVSDV